MSIADFNHFYQHPAGYALVWLLISGGIFGILEKLFPFEKNRAGLRKDIYIDVLLWLIAPLLYTAVGSAIIMGGFYVIFAGNMNAAQHYLEAGALWVQNVPMWLQALLVLILSDFSLYSTHRLFHHYAPLWNFHAIHHGAQEMDFLTAARFHPINVIFHTLLANALCLWAGFAPAAIILLAPFNTLYSCMVHSNLDWSFGKYFRYVLVSPLYHRWHHTAPDEGGNMNFAATFPIFDVIFGTFYMPEGKLPPKTGQHEDYVPKTLLGQLLYPFMPEATKTANQDKYI